MIEEIKRILTTELGIEEIDLEIPEKKGFGDYTTNVALKAAGSSKGKKLQSLKLAREMADKLQENEELKQWIEKVEVAGGGFLNFWLKDDILINNLIDIEREKYDYGSARIGQKKRVVIDYSSPNIAKRFSIGHLRSTIIGQALYNLYGFLGYKVIGDNHLGDWGTQFGKLIYMLRRYPLKSMDVEALEKLYVQYHRLAEKDKTGEMDFQARVWFQKLEKGDKTAKETWRRCVKISLAEFNRIYDLLGVSFDYSVGESRYAKEIKKLLKNKKFLGQLEEGKDGAKIITLDEYGIKTPLMFFKKDGASTYAARDLACIYYRMRRFEPHLIIYEVGQEQILHFKQVFAAAHKLGWVGEETTLYHTGHGLYLSPQGKKFSTRKGEGVDLEAVLKEAIKKARKIILSSQTARGLSQKEIDRVSQDVGIGAVKYYDLKHAVQSNIVFDWQKILDLEGNSGPYLQYTFARCFSVLSKAKKEGFSWSENLDCLAPAGEERDLARLLYHFPEMVKKSAFLFSPNILCAYLFDLARLYNRFYDGSPILKEKDLKLRSWRLGLTEGTAWVLRNGLRLLGIEIIEKM